MTSRGYVTKYEEEGYLAIPTELPQHIKVEKTTTTTIEWYPAITVPSRQLHVMHVHVHIGAAHVTTTGIWVGIVDTSQLGFYSQWNQAGCGFIELNKSCGHSRNSPTLCIIIVLIRVWSDCIPFNRINSCQYVLSQLNYHYSRNQNGWPSQYRRGQ